MLRFITAAALAFAVMALAGQAAHARAQSVISCDRFGCSDHGTQAKTQHQARRHPSNIGTKRYESRGRSRRASLVTMQTAAGEITVETGFAQKIVPLINDLKGMGFAGSVHCFAATQGNHVPNSRHFSGRACDFLPKGRVARGRNRMPTPAIMYTRKVADLIERYGLRNGCSFNDCGHIDDGPPVVHRRRAIAQQ